MEFLIAGIIVIAVLYYVVTSRPAPDVKSMAEQVSPSPVEEEPAVTVTEEDLLKMSKVEIDEMARSLDIKLDRRRTKARMIEQFLELR